MNNQNWSNLFWSENHIMTETEKEQLDLWFYKNLFSEDQYQLTLDFFDNNKTIVQRNLSGNSIGEFLFFADQKPLELSPKELDTKIKNILNDLNYEREVYWFTCYQSHTYNHDLSFYGVYTFESKELNEYNGELFPVFNKLVKPNIGHDIDTNLKLYSGLIDKNKKWLLLVTLDNDTDKQISIKVAGNSEFCQKF